MVTLIPFVRLIFRSLKFSLTPLTYLESPMLRPLPAIARSTLCATVVVGLADNRRRNTINDRFKKRCFI